MANIITAGNSTNGGTSVTTDTSGILNIVTGSGSGANAITIDTSQNVVFSGGVSGVVKSGTAVTPSGTSVDFTGIPSTAKRVTVMFSGLSSNGTSVPIIQLGTSSGAETTGYTSGTGVIQASSASQNTGITSGIAIAVSGYLTAASAFTGAVTFTLIGSNAWVASGNITREGGGTTVFFTAGSKTTAATLDRVRFTTVNGTDAFDAGTVNILWE